MSFLAKIGSILASQEAKISSLLAPQASFNPPDKRDRIVDALTFIFKTTVDQIDTSHLDQIQLLNPETVQEGFHKVIRISQKAMRECILPLMQANPKFRTCDFTLSLIDNDALKALSSVSRQLNIIYMTRFITKEERVISRSDAHFKYEGSSSLFETTTEITKFDAPVVYVINPYYTSEQFSKLKKNEHSFGVSSGAHTNQRVTTTKIVDQDRKDRLEDSMEDYLISFVITDPFLVYMQSTSTRLRTIEKNETTCLEEKNYSNTINPMDRTGYAIVAKCWVKKEKHKVYSLRKQAAHDPRIHFPIKNFGKIGLEGVSICQSGEFTTQDTKFTQLDMARRLRSLPTSITHFHDDQSPRDPPDVEEF
jgi:hypothetical protein